MSEALLEERRKIELPRALRQIVRLLAEEGPLTYEELAEKLEKDESTVIRQCQKLIEMEILVKVDKEGKAAVALADGVEADEEGNVYIPSPFEDPVEQLKQLLEEAGVKGRKLRWIMRLVESNPQSLHDPNILYDTLTGAGVRRQLAQQIVKAFFGTNFVPMQPPQPQMPRPGTPYPYNSYYGGYGFPGYQPPAPPALERELLKLEMRFEKLLEELRREKEEKPSIPMVRRIKTDEQGRPVEIIEEPAWMARSDSSEIVKLLMYMMDQTAKQREEMYKLIYSMQKEMKETVEKLTEAQKDMLRELRDAMMEQERKRMEEMAKLREELIRKDAEWERKLFEERLKEMRETIQGIKNYYENQMQKVLEELKKEWEWRERLRELEERRTLRDVVVEEIRAAGKELMSAAKEMRQVLRDYMEQQIRQNIAQKQVPEVHVEEKRRILEALRRATGRAPAAKREQPKEEAKAEEGPKVQLKIVGGEEESA